MRNTHVPVGPWRGVNTNQNGIYMECFIEEVARAAGKDSARVPPGPDAASTRSIWPSSTRRRRRATGASRCRPACIAASRSSWATRSYSAAVAEVSVSPAGEVKVHRMVLALNCGHAVNPDQIAAQVEGSVAYGLSAALHGENTIEKGRVKELNFDTYRVLRLAEMPKVETVIVPTHDFWGGVGEPTICVVAPAVMNAILAATGKPVRSLPLKNEKLA